MAFNVTSNFSGKAAGFYVSQGLALANSLDYMTMMENVKYKQNIQRIEGTTLVRNSECDFTDYGTLAMTEKVLTVKNLQINIDLCKENLLASWESLQMRAGAGAMPPASFDDYVISYLGEIIGDATEASVWSGADATNGQFEGFLTAATGMFAVDGTVQTSAASGAYTTGNIIANLQTLTSDMATKIPAILRKEDLYIYMSPKTYALYISAISTLGYVNAYNMNGDYDPVFEGYKIAPVNGMADDQLVAAEKSNLFFGTDLISDSTRISLLDGAAWGSDNLRVVARYSAAVQLGVGVDIVHQT